MALIVIIISLVVGSFIILGINVPSTCRISTYDQEHVVQVLVDENDNIILIGITNTKNFPSTFVEMNSSLNDFDRDEQSIFVSKFSQNGLLIWSRVIGGENNSDIVRDAVFDNYGNILIVGVTRSNDFPMTINSSYGKEISKSTRNCFVLKLAENGSIIWSNVIGGSRSDDAIGIAVDTQDNIIITGDTHSIDFPITDITGNKSSLREEHDYADAFIMKLSSNGEIIFSYFFGGTYWNSGCSLDIDVQDDIILAGKKIILDNGEEIILDNGEAEEHFDCDIFLAKLYSNGTIQWVTEFGGSEYDRPFDLAIDNQSNILITGWTSSNDFLVQNPQYPEESNYNNPEGTISKLSSNGEIIWSTYAGTKYAYGLEIDNQNNIIFTGGSSLGIFTEEANTNYLGNLSSEECRSTSEVNIKVFSSNGSSNLSDCIIGGKYPDFGQAIALDSDGNIIVGGYTYSDDFPVFNGIHSEKNGDMDVFLLKLTPQYEILWGTFFGGAGKDNLICE